MSEFKKFTQVSVGLIIKEEWVAAFEVLKEKEKVLQIERLGDEEIFFTLFSFLDLETKTFDTQAFDHYVQTGTLPESHELTFTYRNIMDNSGSWLSEGRLTSYNQKIKAFYCNGSFVSVNTPKIQEYLQQFLNTFAASTSECRVWREGNAPIDILKAG